MTARYECTGVTETCQAEGGECSKCSIRDCPHGEPFHYHHDGCPACAEDDIDPDCTDPGGYCQSCGSPGYVCEKCHPIDL